jgi:hypothetical protein
MSREGEVRPEQAHRVRTGGSFVENHGDERAGRTSRSTFGKRMDACYLLGDANLWRTVTGPPSRNQGSEGADKGKSPGVEAWTFAQSGTVMDASRRTSLIWLASGWFMLAALIRAAVAQDGPRRVIEARIEDRKVVAPREAIRITEGDVIELRWTSDEPVSLHLHGYDVELHVRPDEPAVMVIEAYATGRFPITSHGWGKGGHGHDELTYLEVYPR